MFQINVFYPLSAYTHRSTHRDETWRKRQTQFLSYKNFLSNGLDSLHWISAGIHLIKLDIFNLSHTHTYTILRSKFRSEIKHCNDSMRRRCYCRAENSCLHVKSLQPCELSGLCKCTDNFLTLLASLLSVTSRLEGARARKRYTRKLQLASNLLDLLCGLVQGKAIIQIKDIMIHRINIWHSRISNFRR